MIQKIPKHIQIICTYPNYLYKTYLFQITHKPHLNCLLSMLNTFQNFQICSLTLTHQKKHT